jgi:tripartite tricarboxylate transporter family receptor
VPDLLAGRVTMSFANVANVAPLVKEGKLRGFAVSSRKRSVVAPDLPTMIELGYPDFEAVPWFGLMAPAGTSSAFRADMSSVGERELLRPKIRRRPPGSGRPADDTHCQSKAWPNGISNSIRRTRCSPFRNARGEGRANGIPKIG